MAPEKNDAATMTQYEDNERQEIWSTKAEPEQAAEDTVSTRAVNGKMPGDDLVIVVLVTKTPPPGYGKRYRVALTTMADIGDWNDFEAVSSSVDKAIAKAKKNKDTANVSRYTHSFHTAMELAHNLDRRVGNNYWGTEHGVRISDWSRDDIAF